MRSFKVLTRRLPSYNHQSIRYSTSQYQRSESPRDWRLPKTDDDIERFLMKWQNVTGHQFLENMRDQCINFGMKNMSDKQKQAIKNCVGHKDTRMRRV